VPWLSGGVRPAAACSSRGATLPSNATAPSRLVSARAGVAGSIGAGIEQRSKRSSKDCVRLLQGQHQPCKRPGKGRRSRLSPAHCRTAQYRPDQNHDLAKLRCPVLRHHAEICPESARRPRRHEPGWKCDTGREPCRMPASRLRLRYQARPATNASVGDIPSVPGELFAKFQTSFYADPVDAVFKALGVE